MSAAQVTEAHRGLAQNIVFYHTPKGSSTAQGVRDAAQLIANSEARATAELRAEVRAVLKIVNEQTARAEEAEHDCRVLICQLNDAQAELDGIRALADRRNERDHSQDTTHQLVAALDQALDIAQAELADLKANNRFQRGHSAGYAEAKADCEAELATERAKVKLREAWLCGHTDGIDCGSGQRSTTDFVTFDEAEAKGHVAKYKGSWTMEGWYRAIPVRARAAIDAAMKEKTK